MKVVILAGGLGTRISEETETKPKPMVLIDDKPINDIGLHKMPDTPIVAVCLLVKLGKPSLNVLE